MIVRRTLLAAGLAAALAGPAAAQWGNIVGKVTLDPSLAIPAAKPLELKPDAPDRAWCVEKGAPADEALVVDAKTRAIKNVFVYLKAVDAIHPSYPQTAADVAKADAEKFLKDNGVAWDAVAAAAAGGKADVAKLKADAMIDQVRCVFVPRALAMREGQKLLVKNPEPCPHNTNCAGFDDKNKFNDNMPPKTVLVKDLAPETGAISVQCNIHGWMQMYVMVLPHPYYQVTGADGAFKLTNVKAGKYKLMVRNADGFMFVRGGMDVTVEEGKDAAADVAVAKLPAAK